MISLRPWANEDLWLLHATLGEPVMMRHLGAIESPEQIERRHDRYVNGRGLATQAALAVVSLARNQRKHRGQ